jgi:hypothetical protein
MIGTVGGDQPPDKSKYTIHWAKYAYYLKMLGFCWSFVPELQTPNSKLQLGTGPNVNPVICSIQI